MLDTSLECCLQRQAHNRRARDQNKECFLRHPNLGLRVSREYIYLLHSQQGTHSVSNLVDFGKGRVYRMQSCVDEQRTRPTEKKMAARNFFRKWRSDKGHHRNCQVSDVLKGGTSQRISLQDFY